ncbi:MAG TPA: hypothetical protein VMF87_19665 [Streptosporangiaceae bacterium]|nr:hypothetical protein [Streptosporangiaceae bacterium]
MTLSDVPAYQARTSARPLQAAADSRTRVAWPRLSRLIPVDVTTFRGPWWTAGALAAVNVIGTARSLVHILAPDSGAQSIATMDTQVTGGGNIVSLLAQWGGAQLLESGIIWIVLWRYRGLVPLMLGVVTAEQLLRVAIGTSKPLTTTRTPPGALSRALLPAAAAALAISLTERDQACRPSQDHRGMLRSAGTSCAES